MLKHNQYDSSVGFTCPAHIILSHPSIQALLESTGFLTNATFLQNLQCRLHPWTISARTARTLSTLFPATPAKPQCTLHMPPTVTSLHLRVVTCFTIIPTQSHLTGSPKACLRSLKISAGWVFPPWAVAPSRPVPRPVHLFAASLQSFCP